MSILYLLPSLIIINKEQDQELSIDKSESELKIEIAIESAIKRVNETGIKSFVKFKRDTFEVVDVRIEPKHQQYQSHDFLQPDVNKYYHCPACFGKGLGLTRQGFLYNFGSIVWALVSSPRGVESPSTKQLRLQSALVKHM